MLIYTYMHILLLAAVRMRKCNGHMSKIYMYVVFRNRVYTKGRPILG